MLKFASERNPEAGEMDGNSTAIALRTLCALERAFMRNFYGLNSYVNRYILRLL